MFKAIFWDNDGVLVNTEPLYFRATEQILAEHNIQLTRDFYVHRCLKKNESSFVLAEARGFDINEINLMKEKRNDLYLHLLKENVPMIDGVKETLNKLCRSFFMGIVTNSRRSHFEIISKAGNFQKYFNFFITNEDVMREKPNPDPYLKALQKTPYPPSQCLVIEDTERGLVAAKKAGLTCYVIPNELSKENDFSLADKILKSIKELPALIL